MCKVIANHLQDGKSVFLFFSSDIPYLEDMVYIKKMVNYLFVPVGTQIIKYLSYYHYATMLLEYLSSSMLFILCSNRNQKENIAVGCYLIADI